MMTTASPPVHRVSPGARPGATLAIVLTSYFMIVLDNSIIFTGLPQIQDGLGLPSSGLAWVAHQLRSTLGVAMSTAVRAGVASLQIRVVDAYIGGSMILLAALLVCVATILPADTRHRRSNPPRRPVRRSAHV